MKKPLEFKVKPRYADLKRVVEAHKILGHKIVCTIGSWDMLHIGHVRYLNTAKSYGDILIVGVDSDRGIKSYKGPLRPIIPEAERMEMLSYQDSVDYVTRIDDIDEKGNWKFSMLDEIPVDVFIAVEDSYSEKQCREIRKRCKELHVLPRQAEKTSSTDIIQNVLKTHLLELVNKLKQ